MSITDEQLLAMIEKSQFGKSNNSDDYWFSYSNQKTLAFHIARDLLVAGESVDVSIETAKTFIDKFYISAMKQGSWER